MKRVFVIEQGDNVGTAVLEPIDAGETVQAYGRLTGVSVMANQAVPYGHKIALQDIPRGGAVIKYGLSIGTATVDIKAGDHVHVHNVESNRGRGDLAARKA